MPCPASPSRNGNPWRDRKRGRRLLLWLGLVFCCLFLLMRQTYAAEPGLVGYWKLRGDSKDYSGQGRHGQHDCHGEHANTISGHWHST